MDKLFQKRLKRSFGKTLLDSPVPNRKIKFFPTEKGLKSKAVKVLPEPLKPTKYVPPKPEPEAVKPVPLPRLKRSKPREKNEKVQKVIDEIELINKKNTKNRNKRKEASFKKLCQII